MKTFQYCPRCATPLTQAERGGKIRVACGNCHWVHWDNPTPVVAAVVEQADHIILVQSIGWPDKWFGLVTGFLEKEEHPAEAVLREVKEELSLDATMGSFIGLYPFPMMNQIIMAYHVTVPDLPITIDTTELQAFKRIALAKVRPWQTATGEALKDWLITRQLWPAE